MRGAAAAIVGFVALVAIVDCGSQSSTEPTQIVVTVDTTPGECKLVQKTLVRVDTFDDHAPSAGEKAGCNLATSHIGEFVLVPKGADDAEVQFQVVTGVARNPDECHADDSIDCIFAKRVARFIPHQTLRLSVLMSGACRGKTCKANETCNDKGQCVSATGNADAGATPVDAGPKTPREKCEAAGCLALQGASCTEQGVCQANCGTDQQCNLTCPPGLACVFNCGKSGACAGTSCDATNPSCEVQCATSAACGSVTCNSDTCTISCGVASGEGAPLGCQTLNVGSKAPTIDCAKDACGTLNCNGPGVCQCPSETPKDCNGGSALCGSCHSH